MSNLSELEQAELLQIRAKRVLSQTDLAFSLIELMYQDKISSIRNFAGSSKLAHECVANLRREANGLLNALEHLSQLGLLHKIADLDFTELGTIPRIGLAALRLKLDILEKIFSDPLGLNHTNKTRPSQLNPLEN